MAKVTADMVKPGKFFWLLGFDKERALTIPVRIEITSEVFLRYNIPVVLCRQNPYQEHVFYHEPLYLGDLGIRPLNYDNRPTQMWTTKMECKRAIRRWKGRNPNFLEEEIEK